MNRYHTLEQLIKIDSPSGFTESATQFVHQLLTSYGYSPTITNKGAVKCALGTQPRLVIAGHLDTLGFMVSEILPDGTLSISMVGSPSLNDAEGGHVRIYTQAGKIYTGSLLLYDPAKHANKDLATLTRSTENMTVRIDEEVYTAQEVRQLGIRVGDFVCQEPHYQELPSGFIKSRFLDNKAGCYVLFEIARRLKEQQKQVPVELFFSNYEEVGHGAAGGYASEISEMLVIDMGVIGKQLEGRETACSICAKDAFSPYDYSMRTRLTQLAEAHQIPYFVDVYPYYSSDGSAAWRSGAQFRVALIGMGVSASHGSERTHTKGIEATIDLCLAYIEAFFSSI
jgi:putative aminopeptidase FrvX